MSTAAPDEGSDPGLTVRFWIATEDGAVEVARKVAPAPYQGSWLTRVSHALGRWSMEDTTGYGIAEHVACRARGDE